ncbi:MAG: PIN domain-containing protein [Treponema sp.]|nr:PIN domain-containing protein [Treponema sp.]
MTYLLDACALLAYIKKEPEGIKVKELLNRAGTGEIAIRMSIINLTEAYYGLIRDDAMEMASEIMRGVDDLPITIIDTVSRETARFKVRYSMSLLPIRFSAPRSKAFPPQS